MFTVVYFSFLLSLISVSCAEFTVAKFFTSHMVLQVSQCYFLKSYLFTFLPFSYFSSIIIIKEAPQAANIFGAYSEGPVFIGVECQSGLTFQYEADLVSSYLGMYISTL